MQLIQNMNNERTETALASICDDLSFSMYVEESIVETCRELEQKKIKAVNGNFFFIFNVKQFIEFGQMPNALYRSRRTF